MPFATVNQLPRHLGFGPRLTPPRWLREYSFVISVVLLAFAVLGRRLFFQDSALGVAVLLGGLFLAALVGGFLFRGKSGWCGTLCPLAPVERLYGQVPLRVVRNSHCAPCTACMKNCYDFNPRAAYLADMYDKNPHHAQQRQFFASAFPGLILAFYTSPEGTGVVETALDFGLCIAVSLAASALLYALLHVTPNKIPAFSAALALSLYYWFTLPGLADAIGKLVYAAIPEPVVWAARALVIAGCLPWLAAAYARERSFVSERMASRSRAATSAS